LASIKTFFKITMYNADLWTFTYSCMIEADIAVSHPVSIITQLN